MATVEPKALYGVSPAEPQQKYFTVAIAQGSFSDAASTAGGRVSPCVASDFATKPTTLAESLKVSRGNLRWKMVMESLQLSLIHISEQTRRRECGLDSCA